MTSSKFVALHPKTYTEYRDFWRSTSQREFISQHPIHLDIELSSLCNLKCSMCWQSGDMTVPKNHMDIGLFKKIIDEGVSNGLASIKLQSRGESLLYPDILEAIKYASDAGVLDIQLTTNSTLIDQTVSADELVMSGLNKLIFSYDQAHIDSYKELYSKNIDIMKKINEVLESAKKNNSKLKTRIQTFVEDPSDQEKTLEYLKDKFPLCAEFLVNVLWNSSTDSPAHNILEEYNLEPCNYLWQRLVIFANGSVSLCCRDYNETIVLGNAFDSTIQDLWTGKLMTEYRKIHTEDRRQMPICKNCEECSRPKDNSKPFHQPLHFLNTK